LDEARIMLNEALQKLTTQGNTRARALVRLAAVEWSASRNTEALRILTENSDLFKRITNHAIRGAYHSQIAIVLRHLANAENKKDYLKRAIGEFEQADYHFKVAKNKVFRSDVKNNVGLTFFSMGQYQEAHRYLKEARCLAVGVRDKIRTAQFDESRAQVLIAEGRLVEADSVARSAISVF
jgi:tetratricopeptide (TPR) repeat protein